MLNMYQKDKNWLILIYLYKHTSFIKLKKIKTQSLTLFPKDVVLGKVQLSAHVKILY